MTDSKGEPMYIKDGAVHLQHVEATRPPAFGG